MVRYNIVAMTTNIGPSENGGTPVERQGALHDALEGMENKPTIVFAQEISAPTKKKKTSKIPGPWKIAGLEKYEVGPSDKEAGVAWHPSKFTEVITIDQGEKDSALVSLERLCRPMKAQRSAAAHTDRVTGAGLHYDEVQVRGFGGGRAAMVVLRHKRSGTELLCVSWHGRYSGISAQQKEWELYILLDLVNKLLGDYKCHAAIIGGDFNIPKRSVHQYLTTEYSAGFTMIYPSNPSKTKKNRLDFFLWRGTESFTFEKEVQTWTIDMKTTVLDHYPAIAVFSFQTKANPEVSRAVLAREDWAALDALASFFQMVNSQRRLEDGTLRSDSESSESSDSTSDPDSTSGPSSESDDPDRRKRRSASDNACDSDSTESDSTSGPSSESDSS